MGELTREEFVDRLDDGPVFVPVGSTDQHGPHLPLNVDTVSATELAERAANRTDGLVAPPLPYGFKSQADSRGGPGFPGTTHFGGETLRRPSGDVIADLVSDGADHVGPVNGHNENEHFLRDAIDIHLDDGEGLIKPDERGPNIPGDVQSQAEERQQAYLDGEFDIWQGSEFEGESDEFLYGKTDSYVEGITGFQKFAPHWSATCSPGRRSARCCSTTPSRHTSRSSSFPSSGTSSSGPISGSKSSLSARTPRRRTQSASQ